MIFWRRSPTAEEECPEIIVLFRMLRWTHCSCSRVLDEKPRPTLAFRLYFHVVCCCMKSWASGERNDRNNLWGFSKLFFVDLYSTMSFASTSESYRLAKIVVDQLRTEKNVKRIKVSEAANELKSYVEKIQREDPLVTGVPGNQNPFKDKSSCTLIWHYCGAEDHRRSCALEMNWNARSMDEQSEHIISQCDIFVLLCIFFRLFLGIFPAGILDIITREFRFSAEMYMLGLAFIGSKNRMA